MSTTTTTKTIKHTKLTQTSFLYRLFLDILILISLLAFARNLPQFLQQITTVNNNCNNNNNNNNNTTNNVTIATLPANIGFFCNDNSLKYPFKEDTITEKRLNQLGLQLPLAVIFTIELLHFRQQITAHFIGFVLQLYVPLGRFLFGYAAERIFKGISNFYFLRLRPNFFAVCQPQALRSSYNNISDNAYDNETDNANICHTLFNTNAYHEYMINYTCKNATPQLLLQRVFITSFYSGHAGLICYSMLFMVLYLQQRYVWQRTKYLLHVIQLICLLVAWCVSLSRIWDNMHHVVDVVVGALLGAILAVIAMHCVHRSHKAEEATYPAVDDTSRKHSHIEMMHSVNAVKF